MTYAEDLAAVTAEIGAMVDAGRYPAARWA
jgi:hypothetical protein